MESERSIMDNQLLYVYFVSLGCSKNFVDTEVMAASLLKKGIGITDDPAEASIYAINTCAFIPPARQEAEDNINEAITWKEEDTQNRKLIVTGCLTQWDKKGEYQKLFSQVDLWMGINELQELPDKIASLYSDSDSNRKKVFCDFNPDYLYNDKTPRLQLTPSHYAYIKIAEGCDNRCAYCSIPSIRGTLRSRKENSIIKEANNLLSGGTKELLVIAQDITAFGRDKKYKDGNLASLITKLDEINGKHWIRLHYLHPETISDEFISALKNSKHIIPYLDIPLQHISDRILKSMNRKVTANQVRETIIKLREAIPSLTFRTTFIVGFPGETEKEFNELCDFVSEYKFERLGVFPFFPEPNTKAFDMEGQIDNETATKRADIIQELHRENSISFNKQLVGRKFDVIIDNIDNNYLTGRTYMDSPDIDNTVVIYSKKKLKIGNIVSTKITNYSDFDLEGKLV